MKFRLYDNINKEMIYDPFSVTFYDEWEEVTFLKGRDVVTVKTSDDYILTRRVEGDYKDSNGKDLYIGDIVMSPIPYIRNGKRLEMPFIIYDIGLEITLGTHFSRNILSFYDYRESNLQPHELSVIGHIFNPDDVKLIDETEGFYSSF